MCRYMLTFNGTSDIYRHDELGETCDEFEIVLIDQLDRYNRKCWLGDGTEVELLTD